MSRPNILFICTDQQSATMMSCAGNRYLRTPAMDQLAATGVRFERAYCGNPVCIPSRISMMTGRLSSETGIRDNRLDADLSDEILDTTIGRVMERAGYDLGYGGKVHLPQDLQPRNLGFEFLSEDERDELPEACAEFIKRKRDRPFFLAAHFINPHDICYMAIRDFAQVQLDHILIERGKVECATLDEALKLPEGVDEETFFRDHCPPLPPSYGVQEDEPEAIRMLQALRPFKRDAREKYSDEQWRTHRWAYCRLTEKVDAQIARVLSALRESGQEEDTVVIFTSDHGDLDSAHHMEHKTAFYDEAARVPFIVSQPGTTRPAVDGKHLVSNGLDLLATLCDYAEVDYPNTGGMSVRPVAEGRDCEWRSSVPVESEIGRMVVTDRFKYGIYDEGASNEQLINLLADPHELRNALRDPGLADVVVEHRKLFAQHFPEASSLIPSDL